MFRYTGTDDMCKVSCFLLNVQMKEAASGESRRRLPVILHSVIK